MTKHKQLFHRLAAHYGAEIVGGNRAGMLTFTIHNAGGGMLSATTIEGHLCVGMYFENGDYFGGFTTMYEDWSFERVVETFAECYDEE